MPARLLLAAMFCSVLVGQENGVPVIIDGVEVARVYGPVAQFTAKDRAPEIEHRIVMLAKSRYKVELQTRDLPAEKATSIVAGPVTVMAVTELDAEYAGVARVVLAQRYASSIQKAIEAYRASRSWAHFLAAVLKTLLVWTLFCVSVWALWWVFRWLAGRLQRWVDAHAVARGLHGFHLTIWERSRRFLITTLKVAVAFFILSEFSVLISYTFSLFPQTAGISLTLWDNLRSALGSIGLAIIAYLPSGGFVVVIVVLTHYLLKVLKFLSVAIEHGELTIKGLHPEMAKPTYQLVRIVVTLFALVVAFPYLPGGQSEAFKGISIFLGVLLSFGSSSAVSNILAGLVLTYMRPFKMGDRVKIVDTIGDVLEKNLLVTRVRTIKNVEVVIPNGAILGNQILNYSALARTQGLILHTAVTIGYDAPWRTVHELLIRAALNTDGVLHQPAPFVLETSLNDFHISYELNAYTDRPNDMVNIYGHLHEAIQDSFNKAGVEIMSPTFYALRDGNTVTIPANCRPAGYEPPSFRVKEVTAAPAKEGMRAASD